jgi:5-methylcytosine-specific restriction protein A
MKYCAGDPDCMELVPGNVRACPQHNSRWPTDGRTQRTRTPEHNAWAAQVLINADHRCQIRYAGICTGHAQHADHIKPVTEGGLEFDPTNGQAACEPCHIAKSSDEGHRAQGHRVPERQQL